MKLRQLFEAPQKRTAVVAFGRMNPPTIGHQKLVEKIKSFDGDHYVFLSQTQKPKTDPLAFADKLRFAKFFFPEITIGHPTVRTPMDMMAMLQRLGYTDIIYVAGSDRVDGFNKLFNDYNGKPDKSGNIGYTFDSIEVVSAGERDPDADGAEGMSASKMRAAAAEGDLENFTNGVPRPELADEMFNAVRKGMGIKEPAMADESVQEGNLVLDKGRLRSHIISLIADKIAATDDIDQLAEWLRLIVGKELKARGSRYQISSEDIVEAINMKMSDIVKEENKTPPTKVKPVREPFPQMPQKPTEPVSGENGEIIKPTKNGGVSLGNAAGTFIWDKAGKPSMYITPSMNGIKQVHNMKTGNFTVDYRNKGLNIKQEYDKDGNSIGGADTQYSMGGVTVKQDKQGNRSGTHQMGTKTVNFDPNKPFDPSKAG
jgi:hypothetical protein